MKSPTHLYYPHTAESGLSATSEDNSNAGPKCGQCLLIHIVAGYDQWMPMIVGCVLTCGMFHLFLQLCPKRLNDIDSARSGPNFSTGQVITLILSIGREVLYDCSDGSECLSHGIGVLRGLLRDGCRLDGICCQCIVIRGNVQRLPHLLYISARWWLTSCRMRKIADQSEACRMKCLSRSSIGM
jgi:hypothetical protein